MTKPKHPHSGGTPLGRNRLSKQRKAVRLAKSRLPPVRKLGELRAKI